MPTCVDALPGVQKKVSDALELEVHLHSPDLGAE